MFGCSSRINLIWRSNLNLTRSFGDSDDFSIWSSSRSAVASNLHALPYEVVVLEALTSISRFRINLELYASTPCQIWRLHLRTRSSYSTCTLYMTSFFLPSQLESSCARVAFELNTQISGGGRSGQRNYSMGTKRGSET